MNRYQFEAKLQTSRPVAAPNALAKASPGKKAAGNQQPKSELAKQAR